MKLDQSGTYDNATAKALQIKWLQQIRTVMKELGKWPEKAEEDVVSIVGAYLRRQAGVDEKNPGISRR